MNKKRYWFNSLIHNVLVFFCVGSMVLGLSGVVVFAHGGRTDGYGGHHDYDNVSGLGYYHYHHGYEAHLHDNGYCPYDDCYYPMAPDDPDNQNDETNPTSQVIHQSSKSSSSGSSGAVNSSVSVSSYNEDDDGSGSNTMTLPIILTGIAVIGGGMFINGKVQENKRQKKREEDRAKFVELLSGRSIREAAGVPSDIRFFEGMPRDNNNRKYGSYTRYLSKSGNCYHEKQGCSSASKAAHAFNVAYRYKPCAKCCRSRVIIPEWYENYRHLEKEANRLGIDKDINVSREPQRRRVVGQLDVVQNKPETRVTAQVKLEPEKPKTKPAPQAQPEFEQPKTKPVPQVQKVPEELQAKQEVAVEVSERTSNLRMVSFDINSNGRVEGKLNGKPVTFNSVWGQHSFTEEEIIRLLNDQSITFQYTTKKGKTRTATGKLGYGTGKYASHFGFQPEDF